MLWSSLGPLLALYALWASAVTAVKRNDFKTCAQSGFCNRNRALADRAATHSGAWSSPYSLGPLQPSSTADGSSFTAELKNNLFPNIQFALWLDFTEDGPARVRVDEVNGLRQRFNEAADWTLVSPPALATSDKVKSKLGSKQSEFLYGHKQDQRLLVEHHPLKLTFERDGQTQIVLNERGLFNMEHFRRPASEAEGEQDAEKLLVVQQNEARHQDARQAYPHFLPDSEDGMWTEKWGSHTDSKPKGPESLSMDITFPGYEHVMGIPEHAGPLSLRTTRGGDGAFTDPYRLFNMDVFEYEPDSEMALYGAIPFMQAHRPGASAAVFWLNGAESWVDITKSTSRRKTSASTHWISESGILDLFVFMAPDPKDILKEYTALVGRTAMPQYFAIGHHQCRWNYLNEEDVLSVAQRFDEEDMPLDVIWLDIEYAADHKYFDWDKNNFPNPKNMLSALADTGRQLVAIVDPHIKRVNDFYIYKEAKDLDILLRNKDGKEYEGWCWTGSSSWVDFFDPKSWAWWIGQFKFSKWTDSARNLWIWNDMNEPAIFNGPEMTAPKDTLYTSGWENRDLHNINGVIFHNLTAQALIEREDYARRPFVLSRSFWAGSQRFGAIWTGDNMGTWKHLASASRMILANGVGGMAWSGADIGGFFGNPSPDMLVRWYQAGAFHPFFRAHAHIDTKRREPYLYDDPIKTDLKNMLKLRYSLLPMWYTAFWDSHRTGVPIAMPNYLLFPEDATGIAVDDQYYIGHSGLLVKPIVEEDVTETNIYVPDDQPYYNYFNHDVYFGSSKTSGSSFPFSAPLDVLPLFQRGGSIVPRRDMVRRSAPLMWRDPISLVIALDKAQSAEGTLYLDDGDSYNFEKGDFVWRGFNFAASGKSFQLTSRDLASGYSGGSTALDLYKPGNAWAKQVSPVQVQDIIIVGLSSKPSCIRSSTTKHPLTFEWTEGIASNAGRKKSGQSASELIIEGASLPIIEDWALEIEYAGKDCSVPASHEAEADLQSPLCPPSHFRCENKGHIPACLLVSRVNDGLCDPECCDGSDEFDGKVQCQDRCQEVGVAYRKAREEEARKARVGASTRAEYVKFGQKAKAAAEKAVKDLAMEVSVLEAKEQAAKRALEQAEASSQSDIERKKESTVYRRIEDYHTTLRSLRLDRQQLQAELDDLYAILTDLRAGYNPNYQDMAVKGAVKGFEEWAAIHGYSFSDGEDAVEASVSASEPDHESPADEDVKKMEEEDILGLLDASSDIIPTSSVDATAGLFRLEDYLPMSLRSHYLALVEQLLGFLRSIGALSSSYSDAVNTRPDVVKARSALSDAETNTKKARKNLDKEKATLDKDWGKDWEWKKLDGTCLETNTGEYTYELCLFGTSKQKSNKGGASVNLGKYKSWRPNAESGTTDAYSQQIYDRGTKCWNGPERSTIVEIACGTKNEILSVMELEKCEYQFKIKSPAVCSLPEDEDEFIAKTSTKDEL